MSRAGYPDYSRGRGRGYGQNLGYRSRENRPPGRPAPLLNSSEPWRIFTELSVFVKGLPSNAETSQIYHAFKGEGNISRIDLLEDLPGNRTGVAKITFCPAPSRAFWNTWQEDHAGHKNSCLIVELEASKRNFRHPSPVQAGKFYREHLILAPSTLHFGFMLAKDQMIDMRSIEGGVSFILNLLRREIIIHFSMAMPKNNDQVSYGSTSGSEVSSSPASENNVNHYKIQIPLQQLHAVWEVYLGNNRQALVLPLDAPPVVFRQLHNVDATHEAGGKHWNERRAWARQTDIMTNTRDLKHESIRLRKDGSILDIGRWTTYRLEFDGLGNTKGTYDQVKEALNDYNIKTVKLEQFDVEERRDTSGWQWIDQSGKSATSNYASLLLAMANGNLHLSWPVRYQLEACISQRCLNEYNIKRTFVERLAALPEREALSRLEFAAEKKRRFYDPFEILSLDIPISFTTKKFPKHCSLSRSVTITPTTVYYSSPTVEMSNRILRQYKEQEDRFLRVRFTDEKYEGRIHSSDDGTQVTVFTRIHRCLTNGITIGDRHYEFLAMGNSQFREHGAYFYSPTPSLTTAYIRGCMGNLSKIRTASKWASRLGQCFSTTRAVRGTKVKVVAIDDIERNNYNFTDGVGKLSKFLAQIIAGELGLPNASTDPPSVFQFRLGGAKGVLAISPDAVLNEIHIRPSQDKFSATYVGLEIIRCASFTTAVLNRQLILILTHLGIQNHVFHTMMQNELSELQAAMTDENVALRKLQERIDYNQSTLSIASIMLDGFMHFQDPFAVSMLHLWRAWVTKALKEKAGLPVHKGAFVLGCTDETGTLQGHFTQAQHLDIPIVDDKISLLPQIFIQVDAKKTGKYEVVEKICIVARHPSLHPGDVRVVQAVDIPALHHLKNVVVFPQTGDRDIPNMCSGGDLDGDDFIVIWDEKLIPPHNSWNIPAMDFTGPKPVDLDREVTIEDVSTFFVRYMETDALGAIANAHLANADRRPDSVSSQACLKLAELHSIAVDYPKSGIPAKMPHQCRPKRYPHYMVSKYRPEDKIYHSETVVGQLYDEVKEVDFKPLLDLPFDKRILEAFDLDEDLLQRVAAIKFDYDAAMCRILAQHEIKTEFEVWATFVMNHAGLSNDFKFHEVIGRLSEALRERFQHVCYEAIGSKEYAKVAPFVAAMYTVTALEVAQAMRQVTKIKGCEAQTGDASELFETSMPFITFPWLFQKELGMIANGRKFGHAESVKAEQGVVKHHAKMTDQLISFDDEEDMVETAAGFTHRGELLEIFKHDGTVYNGTGAAVVSGKYRNSADGADKGHEDVDMFHDAFDDMDMDDEMEDGEVEEVGMDMDVGPSQLELLTRMIR